MKKNMFWQRVNSSPLVGPKHHRVLNTSTFAVPLLSLPFPSIPSHSTHASSSPELSIFMPAMSDTACTSFHPRRSKPLVCKTCSHILSAHEPTAVTPPEEVDSTPTPTTIATKERDRATYVGRVLRAIEASSVHETARNETLKGFRPSTTTGVCISLIANTPLVNTLHYSPAHPLQKERGKQEPPPPCGNHPVGALNLGELYSSHAGKG